MTSHFHVLPNCSTMGLCGPVRQRLLIVIAAVVAGGFTHGATGQETTPTAIVGVHVLPMTGPDPILEDQTVIIRNGRFEEIGARATVDVPSDAVVIRGDGQYVMPGLIDAHVHVRPSLRDAPLFLAYGVTSILQTAGGPEFLEPRARTRQSASLPRLFTAARPIESWDPDEAIREVEAAVADGYDVVKVFGHQPPSVAERVFATAKREGMIVIGHAQRDRDITWSLNRGMQIVHVDNFLTTHFNPSAHQLIFFWLCVPIAMVMLVWVTVERWLRRRTRGLGPQEAAVFVVLPVGLVLVVCMCMMLPPYGFRYGDAVVLWVATAATMILGGVGVWCGWSTGPGAGRFARFTGLREGLAAVMLVAVCATMLPRLWQIGPKSIQQMVREVVDAGMPISPTLVQYDYATEWFVGAGPVTTRKAAVFGVGNDRLMRWHDTAPRRTVLSRFRRSFRDRQRGLLGALVQGLHEAGARLAVGTDVGVGGIVPGRSMHEEIERFVELGISRGDALKAATAGSAAFLGEEALGVVREGAIADLLMMPGDPTQDLAALRGLSGVMVAGNWVSRDVLRDQVGALTDTDVSFRLDSVLTPLFHDHYHHHHH